MRFLTTSTDGSFSQAPIPFVLIRIIMTVNRIAATPLFSNLRRFPHGRRFKQWTGDDSKALMKVC
jgi:hypothetical protein